MRFDGETKSGSRALSARKLKPYGMKSAACEDATQPSTVRCMMAGMSAAAAAGGCHTTAIAQMAAATPKRAGGIRDRRKIFLLLTPAFVPHRSHQIIQGSAKK